MKDKKGYLIFLKKYLAFEKKKLLGGYRPIA